VTTAELATDGVVRDMPHDEYLRHPALSASGAKLLVQPGGPARYRHEQDHPEDRRTSDAFDLGHAAHGLVLGVGPALDVVHAADWRGKDARAARDESRAAGRVPILAADYARAERMADALREHPIASRLLHPDSGEPEVSLFWHDDEYGIDRRGRVDWLRRPDPDGRLVLVDYKTTSDASPSAVSRAVASYGYHQQAAWYRDLVIGLGLARSAPFLFLFQETRPPYLPHVVELDAEALAIGADRNARALRLYAECTASGVWPGYGDDAGGISLLGLPRWAVYESEAGL
jgi:hypothetical protein